jgi:hypothetical protein
MAAPRVYLVSNEGKTFNCFFVIAWTNKSNNKNFFIGCPYDQILNNISNSINAKINFSTSKTDAVLNEEDMKMCLIDYQLCMATEILLVARLFDIDLKALRSTDNGQFLNNLSKAILTKISKEQYNAKVKQEKFTLEMDPHYIESFDHPPVYKKIQENWTPIDPDNLDSDEPYFLSLLQKTKKLMREVQSRYPLPKHFTNAFSTLNNILMIPTFKVVAVMNKENSEMHTRFESKLLIWHGEKSTRPTKIQTGPKTLINCTTSELVKLWGGTDSNTKFKKSCMHTGIVFINPPILETKYFKTGQPNSVFSVDKISTKKVDTGFTIDYTFGNEMFGSDLNDYNSVGISVDRDEEENM